MTGSHGSELDPHAYAALAAPHHAHLAQRLAELEGGSAGLLFPSRAAALATITLATARPGGVVLFQRDVAADTEAWFSAAGALGLAAEPIDALEPVKVADALARGARALFTQQLSEHAMRELDVAALAWHARVYGASLCVDNTLLGARHRRPLAQGADLVLHAELAGLCARADAREALVVVRSEELGAHLAAVAAALGALCAPDPAREAALAVAASSYGLRIEHSQRSARLLAERLAKLAGAQPRYPGVGRELGVALAAGLDAQSVLARLPAAMRTPDPSGARTHAWGAPTGLRLRVGLERPDALWDALAQALAP